MCGELGLVGSTVVILAPLAGVFLIWLLER